MSDQLLKAFELMNLIVIGSGGREHALAWKLAQSIKVGKVYVAPGNGGTALDSRLENIAITDPAELAGFAAAWSKMKFIAHSLVS